MIERCTAECSNSPAIHDRTTARPHNPTTPRPLLDCSYPLWWLAMNAGLDADISGTGNSGRLKVAIDGCDENRSVIPHASLPALTATATLAPLSGYPLLLTKSCHRSAGPGIEQPIEASTEQDTGPGYQPMASRTCFRELWVGGAAHSITRNERFGSFRPKGIHPDNEDEGCHQHQLQVCVRRCAAVFVFKNQII